jgi:hypothetical protein
MSKPIEFLAMHAITTLPDSTAARKRLLGAVTGALPRGSEARLTAHAILRSMQTQEQLQAALALNFAQISGVPK